MATVICPNCGGENNVTSKNGQECAYCGTMLQMPTPTKSGQKEMDASDGSNNLSDSKYIVPISTQYSTEENIIEALKAQLVGQDDVPADIFNHLSVKSVKWVYLPMLRFGGDISTEWSCDEVVYRKRKVGEKAIYDRKGNFVRMEDEFETYEDYIPKSGHGHTSFDVLVPAIKSIKESLPYHTIDFNVISTYEHTLVRNGMVLTPSSATSKNATLGADSEFVLKKVGTELRYKAEKCSYGNFIPRSSSLPYSIKQGRESVHEHLSFQYRLNTDGTVGELYYVPFVYVVYSYKEEFYEWGFCLTPERVGSYDYPKGSEDYSGENVESHVDNTREVANKLQFKWNLFLFVSGVLSFLIGMLLFLMRNSSLYERIKKRYKNQEWMYSLLGRYERRENLIKSGADKKVLSKIDSEIKRDFEDSVDDDEDDMTPKSIAEIYQYFAETEGLKKKLLKRMRNFWVWYIVIILFVGGVIGGYCYWEDMKKQQMFESEYTAREAEMNRLSNEVTEKFQKEMVGSSFEGSDLRSFDSKYMKLRILDDAKLQYQLGEETKEWDEKFNRVIRWENPKIVTYSLDVGKENGDVVCCLLFDGYKSSNICYGYGDVKFKREFDVPVDKNGKTNAIREEYHLKKQ